MDYLAKVHQRLASKPRNPIILVLGGSFNPIHTGHVQMFDAAAAACAKQGSMRFQHRPVLKLTSATGLDFVGGFLAVASDDHVRAKGDLPHVRCAPLFHCSHRVVPAAPTLMMPSDLRIQACQAATRSHPSLSVIPIVEGRCPFLHKQPEDANHFDACPFVFTAVFHVLF